MADNGIPQSIANKPVERVVISHPYTARLVEQAKRLDRILRHADDRFARSQMTENRYESIRRQTRDALQSLEQKLSDLDNNSSRRRSRTRRTTANSANNADKAASTDNGGQKTETKANPSRRKASPNGNAKTPAAAAPTDSASSPVTAPASSSTSADAKEGPAF